MKGKLILVNFILLRDMMIKVSRIRKVTPPVIFRGMLKSPKITNIIGKHKYETTLYETIRITSSLDVAEIIKNGINHNNHCGDQILENNTKVPITTMQ